MDTLWVKLISYGIKGKTLKVVKNLYEKAKSCVMKKSDKSDFFNCYVGVRQGENLSPLLFALFVNDMSSYLSTHFSGLTHVSGLINDFCNNESINTYLRLYLLLYADDTVILAENSNDLQAALNGLGNYTNLWDLKVNASKTKVVVFSRGKIRNIPEFTFEGNNIEVVFEYTYLGLIFNYNGKFTKAKSKLVEQANRAMFALLQKIRVFSLPIDLSLDLFDKLVTPILVYGSEVWGCESHEVTERLHLKFMKIILKLKTSTCSDMVYGEMGRLPLSTVIKSRMISFWASIINSENCKISNVLYNLLLKLYEENVYCSPWILYIKKILDECGMSNIWLTQSFPSKEWLKSSIKQKLYDTGIQAWHESINEKAYCDSYVKFKTTFNFENYLTILPQKLLIYFCKFRVRNIKVPNNTYKYSEDNSKICKLCNTSIGDEQHYLLYCNAKPICDLRKKYIPNVHVNNYQQFEKVMASSCTQDLKNIGQFVIELITFFN